MIFQHLGKIFFLISCLSLFSCSESNKKTDFESEKPVEINLTKQYMYIDTMFGNFFPFRWRAEVTITNKSKGVIMINKYDNSNILLCKFIYYKIYGKTINRMRSYPEAPFTILDTLASNGVKTFLIDFPIGKKWTPPDVSYINFDMIFLTSKDNKISSRKLKDSFGDTLEKNTAYQLNFNYIIDQNGTRIRPIEEHVDSIFKNSRVDVDPDFY